MILAGSSDKTDGAVFLVGEPIHCDSNELIDRYKRSCLSEFLAHEARYSIGDYVVVDKTQRNKRIITSIGYSGGYIRSIKNKVCVGNYLRDILHLDIEGVEFREDLLSYYLSYVPNSTWGSLPYSTMFKDVIRLMGGSVLEFNHGGVTNYRSYLDIDNLKSPSSFEEALWEVVTKIVQYCERNTIAPSVMFSGGADSLTIYLALREVLGSSEIPAFTVPTSSAESLTNGHYRAIPVARNVEANIKVIKNGWENSKLVHKKIHSEMEVDIVNSRRPDLALLTEDIPNSLFLHGQNFDALSGTKMASSDHAQDLDLLSAKSISGADEKQVSFQMKTLIQNICYSKQGLSDPYFSRAMAQFVSKKTTSTILDPDAGSYWGVLRGVIATQYPNLLHAPRKPFSRFSQLDVMSAEAQKMDGFFNQAMDVVKALELGTFYGYSQLASKRGTSQSLKEGQKVSFLCMSAPIVSFYFTKHRDLAAALSPKRDIYDFIEKMAGKPYHKLRIRNEDDNRAIKNIESDRFTGQIDTLLEAKSSLLDVRKSNFLANVKNESFRKIVSELYEGVTQNNQPSNSNFLVFNQSISRHLLNLELLFKKRDLV